MVSLFSLCSANFDRAGWNTTCEQLGFRIRIRPHRAHDTVSAFAISVLDDFGQRMTSSQGFIDGIGRHRYSHRTIGVVTMDRDLVGQPPRHGGNAQVVGKSLKPTGFVGTEITAIDAGQFDRRRRLGKKRVDGSFVGFGNSNDGGAHVDR